MEDESLQLRASSRQGHSRPQPDDHSGAVLPKSSYGNRVAIGIGNRVAIARDHSAGQTRWQMESQVQDHQYRDQPDRIAHAVGEVACLVCGRPRNRAYARWVCVGKDGQGTFLRVGDIDWIEAARNLIRIHAGGQVHTLRETTSQIEARLDPEMFLRIHRSTIVNVERIKAIFNGGCGHHSLTLADETRLKVSLTYWPRVKELAR